MSFIQDIISPGGRQMGDAAQTASAAQKAISDKLIALQEKLLGFVQNADQQGMFDPERAAERFNKDWEAQHGQDLQAQAAALGGLGYRPGDSEVDYRLSKEKSRLDQDRALGMDQARQDALNRKIQAYNSTSAGLAPAAGISAQAGQFAMQGAQANMNAQNQTYSNLANLYKGISPYLQGGGNPWQKATNDSASYAM